MVRIFLAVALSIPASAGAESRAGPSDEPAHLVLWGGALLFGVLGIALYASSRDAPEPAKTPAPAGTSAPKGLVLFSW